MGNLERRNPKNVTTRQNRKHRVSVSGTIESRAEDMTQQIKQHRELYLWNLRRNNARDYEFTGITYQNPAATLCFTQPRG